MVLTSSKIKSFFKSFFLAAEFIILIFGTCASLCFMSYMFCGLNYPLVDQQLMNSDLILGFKWQDMFHFLRLEETKPIAIVLHLAYQSLSYQLAFLIILFSFLGMKRRLYELFWILCSSLAVVIFIFVFFPALGPVHELGLVDELLKLQPNLKDFYVDTLAIRNSDQSTVIIKKLHGIVGFPSFHTCSAIAYMYAFRKCGVLTYFGVTLNILMLVSTPIWGNHYLIDMAAGLIITLFMIALTVRFSHKIPETKLLLWHSSVYRFFIKVRAKAIN